MPPGGGSGAQVSATDVRSATREQILSLGAKPIFVENVAGIEGEGQGGYAGEMSPEYQAAQAELVSSHIAKQDVVITTALIPGRPAPRLISDAQIATMRRGSVIVDLAAEAGGNVEGCVAGESVVRHGVTIIGAVQLSRTPCGRRVGAVRAQPLQFPRRFLGAERPARSCRQTMKSSSRFAPPESDSLRIRSISERSAGLPKTESASDAKRIGDRRCRQSPMKNSFEISRKV